MDLVIHLFTFVYLSGVPGHTFIPKQKAPHTGCFLFGYCFSKIKIHMKVKACFNSSSSSAT